MEEYYPTIVRRYTATFIDGGILGFLVIAVAMMYQGEAYATRRVSTILLIVLVYEPFATSLICTVGQFITGIRIRTVDTYEKISLPLAYIRVAVKFMLGWYSFFSILFSDQKRAIHDYASGTVVLLSYSPCLDEDEEPDGEAMPPLD